MRLLKSLWVALTLTATAIIILAIIKFGISFLCHYFGDNTTFIVLTAWLFLLAWFISYRVEK